LFYDADMVNSKISAVELVDMPGDLPSLSFIIVVTSNDLTSVPGKFKLTVHEPFEAVLHELVYFVRDTQGLFDKLKDAISAIKGRAQ
jgi:hypothetical protein